MRRNQYSKYKDIPHICYACDAISTPRWCLNPPTYLMLCSGCYARIVQQPEWRKRNPEMVIEQQKKFRPRTLNYRGRRILFTRPIRSGICSYCGKYRGHNGTAMHHERYDDDDPLAHTIELCRSCHRKHHGRDTNTGRFIR